MIYHVIGLMSGSSLDGLDIAFVKIVEEGGSWDYEFLATDCIAFDPILANDLRNITHKNLTDFFVLHTRFGHWIGSQVNAFIDKNNLHHQVNLIASHGHTALHMPHQQTTVQIGCGASIAAETGIVTVSDLRAMDVAFGGQGAPIVPIADQYFFKDYDYLLNIGGIANITWNQQKRVAFDICPANRVLNALAQKMNIEYDAEGSLARKGSIHQDILKQLNSLSYYSQSPPKSLANEFGLEIVLPMVNELPAVDALATMTHHIAQQIALQAPMKGKILITGGGAFNNYLLECITQYASHLTIVPANKELITYKEALAMALIGVLRWREERNVLASVTGATQDSISGTIWMV
jgi:anhydro-N-acetylmuramic acid kinase